jgi:ribose/xylose/arabinose/galactoside ABC-type transport system permease subunit
VIISIIKPVFLTTMNLTNVFRQVSMIGIIAVGMTFVILSAQLDLSVGSIVALIGTLASGLQVRNEMNTALAVILTLILSIVIGLISGIIITKMKVHSFIVTLGMLSIVRGFMLLYTRGRKIDILIPSFEYIGAGMIGPVPVPVIIYIAVIAIAAFTLSKTRFGRHVYAVGGNAEATRLSGISVDNLKIIVMSMSSFSAGLSGIILSARISAADPLMAEGWELNAIAAVIIGGTSLFGGQGGVGKTVVGTLFLGVLTTGLNLMGVSPYYQMLLIGILIVVAVVIDQLKRRILS